MSGPRNVEGERALASYLEPEVSPARLARSREAIVQRLRARRLARRTLAGAGLAAVLAAGASWWLVPSDREQPAPDARAEVVLAPGGRLETARTSITAYLDGARLELSPHTAVREITRTRSLVAVELEDGRASFDVPHDSARQFRVDAGSIRVLVLGTRFAVARSDGRVEVSVERGRVEVRRGAHVVLLGAGESWQGDEREPDEASARVEQDQMPAPVPIEPAVEIAATDAPRANGSEDSSSARALFEAARQARREGRPDRAAALFAELVHQHPGDPRAAVAAFELGRIRLDVMHDVSGSIEALERALALSPNASFRPDALARLVAAYDRNGRTAECREARARYLADYASGAHRATVRSHCE